MNPRRRAGRGSAAAIAAIAVTACSYDFDAFVSDSVSATAGRDGSTSEPSDAGMSDGGSGGSGRNGGTGGLAGSGAAAGSGSGSARGGTSADSGAGGTAGSAGGTPDDGGDAFDCSAIGGTEWQGHCYFAIARGTGLLWKAAKNACESYSPPAHLVTITSSAEEQMLEEEFFPATSDHWIGLSLEDTSSDPPNSCSDSPDTCPFLWVTGETLTYTKWGQHSATDVEPNYTGACVRMQFDDLYWADYGCGAAQLPALCEMD